ncbi:unnamed protein product [Lota lota]
MFSSGNITEKLQIAVFDCKGETVVDLCLFGLGIGYFTLPYLMHASASHVHTWKWNPENFVQDRCTVHHKDNRTVNVTFFPRCIGFLPSSEEGWPVVFCLLRSTTGSVLHIHHNIASLLQGPAMDTPHFHAEAQGPPAKRSNREVWKAWANDMACCIARMLKDSTGRSWRSTVRHIEHVKSYAP